MPIDTIQGAAQAQYMKDEGVTSVYILDDAEVYGKGVAKNTQAAAEKLGIKIAGNDSWDGKASNYRALADKIKATGADAVFTGGIIDNNGAAALQGPATPRCRTPSCSAPTAWRRWTSPRRSRRRSRSRRT